MMDTWWVQIGIIALWVGGVLGTAQWLAARRVTDEHVRKFVHIGIGNIILLAWGLRIPLWLALSVSILFCVVTLLSYRFSILASINSINRKSWGTFFYALSIAVLVGVCWPLNLQVVAVVGILIMTWGDALAALVGQAYGRWFYKVLGVRKTVEGTLTMAGVSFLVCLAVLGGTFGLSTAVIVGSLGIALAAAGLETVSVAGVDNLTVPLGSAALCSWLIGYMS